MSSDLPNLNPYEARVLGVLVEKSLTTPEHYPLSLNAVTNGSNQKSNRDPVVDFLEAEVHIALQGLVMKHLAGRVSGAGSRTEKYKHNAREGLGLDEPGLAVLAELMMRGAQTAGELRGRANRMSPLPTLDALRAVLDALLERGFVRRLPPSPGSRAERFQETLSPAGEAVEALDASSPESGEAAPSRGSMVPSIGSGGASAGTRAPGLEGRVEELEREVADLRRELASLMDQLGVGGAEADSA